MTKIDIILSRLVRGMGAVGSLFVRRNRDGRYEIAVAPIPALLLATSLVACTFQKTEPFRQCVRSNLAVIQEVVNAF